MKTNSILEVMKTNNIVIPSYLLNTYRKLNITEKELIFLSYLINLGDKVLFDINKFSSSLSFSIQEIMELIGSLTSKNIVNMVTDKKETGMIREYLDINNLDEETIRNESFYNMLNVYYTITFCYLSFHHQFGSRIMKFTSPSFRESSSDM